MSQSGRIRKSAYIWMPAKYGGDKVGADDRTGGRILAIYFVSEGHKRAFTETS
jgi:hypothetical protein